MVHNCVAVIIVVDGSGELDVQAHQKLLLHCRLLALAHLAADEGGCKPSRFTQVLDRGSGQLRHYGAGRGAAIEEQLDRLLNFTARGGLIEGALL